MYLIQEALTFLRNIHVTGAVAPLPQRSARALVAQITRRLPDDAACRIVELGAGSGKISDLLVDAYHETQIELIEKLPVFAEQLTEKFADKPHVTVHQGDVFELLADDQFAADLIVSTIPFTFFDAEQQRWLCTRIRQLLAPDGCFVSGQVRTAQNKLFTRHIGQISYEQRIWGVQPVYIVVIEHLKDGTTS